MHYNHLPGTFRDDPDADRRSTLAGIQLASNIRMTGRDVEQYPTHPYPIAHPAITQMTLE